MIDIAQQNPYWTTDYAVKGVFDPFLTFNRSEWFKEENYMKFVKEEENHGIGGLNPGSYKLNESFCLTICS